MQARNDFLVISFGQLTSSTIWPTVAQVASLSTKNDDYPALTYPLACVSTALTYAYDMCNENKVENFLLGNMVDDDFVKFLRGEFKFGPDTPDKEIIAAWNTMCTMDGKDKQNFKDLMSFLSQREVTGIVVSKTNGIQHKHIEGQMKEVPNYSDCLQSGKIAFSLSYVHQTLSLQILAETALGNLNANSESKIYSLHRDVNVSPIPEFKFLCDPFNPNEKKLSEHLKTAGEFFGRG